MAKDQSVILDMVEGETKASINELPECIISSILSLLTIKDAVDTTLISCQWRHRWLYPILTRPNLQFDIANIYGSRHDVGLLSTGTDGCHFKLMKQFQSRDFVRRVNTFLQLYRGNKINSFKVAFFFDRESACIIDNWLRFAITKGVEVLDLYLFGCGTTIDKAYVFPCQLFSELNALTLTHLSLGGCVLRPPPAECYGFNQLRTLCLHDVRVDETFVAHLSSSVCLLLESLALMGCVVGSHLVVTGSSTLKDLKVIGCRRLKTLKISAVNLVNFDYSGNILALSLIKTPTLVRIHFVVHSIDKLSYALNQFASSPGLEILHLRFPPHMESPQTLPTIKNLKQLNLDIFTYQQSTKDVDLVCVLNLLKATPLLEELIITVSQPKYLENQLDVRNLSGFTHDHLRKVKLQGFQCIPYELEFVMCILKCMTKLEMMVISRFGKVYWLGEWVEACNKYESNEGLEEKRRATVLGKLNKVKADARIIIL